MKKIIGRLALVAMMFTMIGIVGCNSNKSKIVGEWRLYAESEDGKDWKIEDDEQIVDFKEDGTFLLRGERREREANWSIDGDEITLSYGKRSITGTIKTLTDKEFVVLIKKNYYTKFKRVE